MPAGQPVGVILVEFCALQLTGSGSFYNHAGMEKLDRVPAKRRPKGALGKPRPADLEALWLIHDSMECGETFDETLAGLAKLNFGGILALNADRTTHRKRLRRWANRYPKRSDVLALLQERASFNPFTDEPLGHTLRVKPIPAADLGAGTPWTT
jgi:hypothetical protein